MTFTINFSTKHTARVKPSQYIAQHLYEQKRKSNCSSCSSDTSYIATSKVFSHEAVRRKGKNRQKMHFLN